MKHCANPECEHLNQFGRIAEFLDAVELCSDCGASLVSGEAPELVTHAYRELVTIYKAATGVQAHLIKGVLEGESIPVSIRGEALIGAVGELPATLLDVEVQVPPEFAARARELALQCDPVSEDDSSGRKKTSVDGLHSSSSSWDISAEGDNSNDKGRESSRGGFLGASPLAILILLTVGAVVGFMLARFSAFDSQYTDSSYDERIEVDQNADCRTDAWYVYQGSNMVRAWTDRNFDGSPDSWDFYEGEIILRSEEDDNFDGKVDCLARVRKWLPAICEI